MEVFSWFSDLIACSMMDKMPVMNALIVEGEIRNGKLTSLFFALWHLRATAGECSVDHK